MKKVLVIAGPTASGKSALGIRLAQMFQGEIISGDSQQVYQELNIGTAKVSEAEQNLIPHHLLNIKVYDQEFSVMEFQKKAREAIENIHQSHHLPILVGGTGFYLKAVLYDYEFKEETTDLDNYEEYSNQALVELLQAVDPRSLEKIHINNRKRLVRALQIAQGGKLKSELESSQKHELIYDAFIVVLTYPKEKLDERIAQRTKQMLKMGLKEEVLTYFSTSTQQAYQSFQGIGYKEWLPYLKGESTQEAVEENITIATRQFAKRQMTWFRHQFKARFVDMSQDNALDQVIQEIEIWSKENT